MKLDDDEVLERANEIVDGFNTIKQGYTVARYLVWLAAIHDSPIQRQAQTITRRTSFWDTFNYADWGVRPGIGIQGLKAALDVLDAIAAFVHLYFRSDRPVRTIDFRTFPYSGRSAKDLAASIAEVLKRPERNRGLTALLDMSAELDEQFASPLKRLVEHRHAATHRFFSVHSEGRPESSDLMQRLSWQELLEESLESLRIARGAILYLAQMIHVHEKSTHSLLQDGTCEWTPRRVDRVSQLVKFHMRLRSGIVHICRSPSLSSKPRGTAPPRILRRDGAVTHPWIGFSATRLVLAQAERADAAKQATTLRSANLPCIAAIRRRVSSSSWNRSQG